MNRYKLGDKFPGIYFTQREAETMALVMRGKKGDDIADILGLSPRTIEYYLERMREKLEADTKFELIDVVLTSDFPKFKDIILEKIKSTQKGE
jgi:DNA-binding CsgD family transcriptional regulator